MGKWIGTLLALGIVALGSPAIAAEDETWKEVRETLVGETEEKILIPMREQVVDAQWEMVEVAVGPDHAVRDRPQRALREIGGSLRIPVVDLLPVLRAQERRGRHPYWQIDGHFSEVGHEVTAASVASAMQGRVRLSGGS